MTRQLRVGIPACVKEIDGLPYNAVGEKYITALYDITGAAPVLMPALHPPLPAETYLDFVDGVLLTGSLSNVHPDHYGGPAPRAETALDTHRDGTTLPLIQQVLERGIPLFAICRGFQELNVACGGTLHQHLAEVDGRSVHAPADKLTLVEKYGPAHKVSTVPGGLLSKITGLSEFEVNSLHDQGIDQLGQELSVEATAPDGTIEAVSRPNDGFCLGVQWHPEWRAADSPISTSLFSAFGRAMADHVNESKA